MSSLNPLLWFCFSHYNNIGYTINPELIIIVI